jgi:hypothetical protein
MAELTYEKVDEKIDENINNENINDSELNENVPNDDDCDADDDALAESVNDAESVDGAESVCSEEGSDYDGEEEDNNQEEAINNETCALFLQQLWAAQRGNIKKRKQDQFLPLTKKFVNSNFVQREKMINNSPMVVKHLFFLCRNIANGKIPTNISGVDKALFAHISDRTTCRSDVRLHLLEQFAVQYYCRQAIKDLEAAQNIYKDSDGGRCKTVVADRHRAIQHDDEDPGQVSKRQKNSRRGKTNSRRRGTT